MMRVEVHLKAAGWFRGANCTRGAAFCDQRLLKGANLAEALPDADAPEAEWARRLGALNGFFAVVSQGPSNVLAAVDRVRSIPLFYAVQGDSLFLSDDADWIRTRVEARRFDTGAAKEFLHTGFVTGRRTLFRGVRQLQPGEFVYVLAGEERVRHVRYYKYEHKEPDGTSEIDLAQALDEVVDGTIQRLATYADGRQIVIPLSGGYDSRLIALMLRRIGYPCLIAFSYGLPGNVEAKTSKRVAEALEIPWRFVPYTPSLWRAAWDTSERRDYQMMASNWASLAHVQDWLATKWMHENGMLDRGAVFTPGHSGDFLAGSHLKGYVRDTDEHFSAHDLADALADKHYSLFPLRSDQREWYRTQLLESVAPPPEMSASVFASHFEEWNWQERQAKFIINSVRVYEFYGYDWWLPLWDTELMDYFATLRLEHRLDQRLYRSFVETQYGLVADVREGNASGRPLPRRVSRFLKSFVPTALFEPLAQTGRRLFRSSADPLGTRGRYGSLAELLEASGARGNGLATAAFLAEHSALLADGPLPDSLRHLQRGMR